MAQIHPAHDMTEATGKPTFCMNGPLNSNATRQRRSPALRVSTPGQARRLRFLR